MSIVLDGRKSSTKCVNAGVLQGNIVGPAFLLAYINDLSDGMINKIVI